jgi:histidine phosphotransferase ChpT
MSDAPAFSTTAADLAAFLAGRLCHDLMSPASALASGIDLLGDPSMEGMREETLDLIGKSARKLIDLLEFCRVAYGASASAELFDAEKLGAVVARLFTHMRPDLVWDVPPGGVSKPAGRAMANLAQIAGAALLTGGVVTVRLTTLEGLASLTVEGEGPRVRLRPEILGGLEGGGYGEALPGHWVQGYYVRQFLADAGGEIAIDVGEGRAAFTIKLPQ